MFAVIDRFEGNYAVCQKDNQEIINIEKFKIPPQAKEGDVLVLGDTIIIDVQETKRRKEALEKSIKDLWD